MNMKKFHAEASKKVVATFTIDGDVLKQLGNTWDKGCALFLKEHSEYKECSYEAHFIDGGKKVLYTFFSIGNIVIVED